jgi:hypothetical protein
MQRVILTRGTRAVKSNSYALLDARWTVQSAQAPEQLVMATSQVSRWLTRYKPAVPFGIGKLIRFIRKTPRCKIRTFEDALVKIREVEHILQRSDLRGDWRRHTRQQRRAGF